MLLQLLNAWDFKQVNVLIIDDLCIFDVFLHQKEFIYGGKNAHHTLTLIENSPYGSFSIT